MGFTIKVERRKLDALCKRVSQFNGADVEVGFFEEDRYGPDNGNLQVATVAYYNEFGTTLNPTRPFMRETFGDAILQLQMAWEMKKVFLALLSDNRQVQGAMVRLGTTVQEMLRVAIAAYPGSNSAKWIAVKGFNDPLFHTGKMLESVKFVIHR